MISTDGSAAAAAAPASMTDTESLSTASSLSSAASSLSSAASPLNPSSLSEQSQSVLANIEQNSQNSLTSHTAASDPSPKAAGSCSHSVLESHEESGLIFKRYYLQCMQQASYLVGDQNSGAAFVIDPRRDADQYLQDCADAGLTLKGVLETHVHADFVSGHMELSEATGARVYISERNKVCYDHVEVKDGFVLRVSDEFSFRALSTPGHTLGCVSWVLEHCDRGPLKVFTGDTLFAGSVGRPDLCGSCAAMCRKPQDMAAMLYDSLWQKLLQLPPEVEVNPTHKDPNSSPPISPKTSFASSNASALAHSTHHERDHSDSVGSRHEAALSSRNRGRARRGEIWTTIGTELKTNPALQYKSKDEFIDYITQHMCERPQYCPIAADMNKLGAECVQKYVESVPKLDIHDFSDIATMDMCQIMVIDTREAKDFAAAHIPDSLNFPLGVSSGETLRPEDGNFAIWIGTVLPPNIPVLVVTPPGKGDETVLRIARIGYQNVLGMLKHGFPAWRDSGRPVESAPLVTDVKDVLARAAPDEAGGRTFLDVRTETEFRGCSGYVRQAVHVPLSQLPKRFGELCKKPEYIVYCSGGYRAAIAASLLRREGFKARSVAGGFDMNLLPNHPELITFEEHNAFAM